MRLIIITALALLLVSCEKDGDKPEIAGSYSGIFLRSAPNARFAPSEVTLHLNEGSFSGTSSSQRYPAICHGSWAKKDDAIIFRNGCNYTADFDWSLILNGSYQYEVSGDRLLMRRVNGEITDVYDLRKD